ncbi:MAG TPA: WGR domain-containing protein, partial [Acidimicrobiales bacterium]|nr:WGR domain-containing protein [Acidimicrobiales bacterium]
MRRFEYIGGGSAKFWEIDKDGPSVTVHFGRIGTAGQTQVKALDSDASAEDHVAKLVGEKVKKGYVETGGVVPQPPPAADLENEESWTVPAAWLRQAEPFRGRGPRQTVTLDPAAGESVGELLERSQRGLTSMMTSPLSDAELVDRARGHLGAPGGLLRKARRQVDPLGAAVVAAGVTTTVYWGAREKLPAVVDDWVASHGLVFAAEAGALLGGVNVFDPSTTQMYNPSSNVTVRRAQPAEFPLYWAQTILVRLRALLAAAEDAEYDQAVARLAGHRSAGDGVRVVTSYLLPTEQAWVDADVAMLRAAGAKANVLGRLLSSATTPAQAEAIFDTSDVWWIAHQPALTYSLGAYVGPRAAPIFARVFDRDAGADSNKRMISMLGQLPTDEAFQLLLERLDKKYVQPVVLKAMERFPRRATRLLPTAATGAGAKATMARDLLRSHALSHPGLVPAELLEQVPATRPTAPVASADQLPDILVTPPWAMGKARPKPVVLAGLGSPTPSTLRWKRGEQASWATSGDSGEWRVRPGRGWPELVKEALTGHPYYQLAVLATAPVELVRPHIRRVAPAPTWDAGSYLRRLLGRLGEDAVDYVVRAALAQPTSAAGALLPIEGSEVALRMAQWHARSKSVRPVAVHWFTRHPEAAARDLVPPALGKPGKDRVAAETALRLLDQHGHRDTVRAAAAAHGSEALAAIDAALVVDPLDMLPARMPSLPGWLDPAHLPPVLLRDLDAALPASAVGHLCTMLAISETGDTYAGVEIVGPALDLASLAEMAWALFERWARAGYPSGDGWVLEALGILGDDETV